MRSANISTLTRVLRNHARLYCAKQIANVITNMLRFILYYTVCCLHIILAFLPHAKIRKRAQEAREEITMPQEARATGSPINPIEMITWKGD